MLDLPFNHTLTIIIITVIISLVAFSNQTFLQRLMFWSPAIKKGQIDRFVTHGFVHADGMHLLFNMITLFFFGSAVENFYRQYVFDLGFVLFYVGAIIIAIIPSFIKHKNNTQWASLGASGAVSAVLFSFILFQPLNLIFVFFIPMPAILFAVLFVGYSIWSQRQHNSNINHSAHLWGAAYGIIVTLALEPSLFFIFIQQLTNGLF